MINKRVGEVWRKEGPCDWLKVVAFHFDDKAMPGVSVVFSTPKGKWKNQRWFWPAKDYDMFVFDQEEAGRRLVK